MAFSSRLLADVPGVRHAFLDVHESGRFDKSQLVDINQVHGTDIIHFMQPLTDKPQADGVFTALSEQLVGVVTADCLPVLMASRDGQYVASVHAGWRGTARGIIARSIQAFTGQGIAAQDIVVAIGPHIRSCCYEVSGEFYDELLQLPCGELVLANPQRLFSKAPVRPNALSAKGQGKANLWFDLQEFCWLHLLKAG